MAKSTEAGASVEIFFDAALKEKSTRNTRERLKDLPNMSFHLEAILGEVGIKDVRALRILGAKCVGCDCGSKTVW